MDQNDVILATQHWVKEFVVQLNLCPFAAVPLKKKQIRYVVNSSENIPEILEFLQQELSLLDATPSAKIETTFLIFQNGLDNFFDYLSLTELAEEWIIENDWEGVFQVASFHPDYQFAQTSPDDVENYTNRSPYPMWHLLREESLEKAIKTYNDVATIPINNMNKLREMGLEQVKKLTQSKDK